MKILWKYATRSRPDWFKDTLTRYLNCFSGRNECQFVVSCDNDDLTMNNDKMREFMKKRKVEFHFGDNKSKVEAINADIAGHDFDILVVVSDDMWPIYFGIDETIAEDMLKYFPDTDGAIGYMDGLRNDYLITFSIMGRKLYDRFGYVYYPEYKSGFCDNEFTEVVMKLNKVKFIRTPIIQHQWHKYGIDEIYKLNDKNWKHDEELFNKRRSENFGYSKNVA